jgi:NAD(P)-dependent dehydrogenase (short-subunit alcohol dehydrogenase family)
LGLKHKRALVTGSTAGIGFAIAKLLAREGAFVYVNGRTEERVNKAVSEIEGKVDGVAADLTTKEGAEKLFARVKDLDIVVNNLGIFEAFCCYTQMGFLRLLTTEAVMGVDVLTQVRAWLTYHEWLASGNATFLEEPPKLETIYRSFAKRSMSSPKEWADSYLAAFSKASEIHLVTFDHGLKSRMSDAILLF